MSSGGHISTMISKIRSHESMIRNRKRKLGKIKKAYAFQLKRKEIEIRTCKDETELAAIRTKIKDAIKRDFRRKLIISLFISLLFSIALLYFLYWFFNNITQNYS